MLIAFNQLIKTLIEQRFIFSPELIYRCAFISPRYRLQNRNICKQDIVFFQSLKMELSFLFLILINGGETL